MATEKTGLRFITGYRYATGLLKAINGMTFFYNPLWEFGTTSQRTLPVAFFHLKGIHEVMESEVQTKKMMFYNSQKKVTSDGAKGSIYNVVADNIVNKPKTYKLDVILPYEDLTMLFNSAFYNTGQLSSVVSTLTKGNPNNSVTNWISTATPYVEVIKVILNALGSIGGLVTSDWLNSIFETPMYNKNSLEHLWKSRTICCLKLWNGWRYKNVVITNIDITKESTEHGVEEASITCTEVPIMITRDISSATKAGKSTFALGKVTSAVGKGISKAGQMLVRDVSEAGQLMRAE